jgi:hypothetical protein
MKENIALEHYLTRMNSLIMTLYEKDRTFPAITLGIKRNDFSLDDRVSTDSMDGLPFIYPGYSVDVNGKSELKKIVVDYVKNEDFDEKVMLMGSFKIIYKGEDEDLERSKKDTLGVLDLISCGVTEKFFNYTDSVVEAREFIENVGKYIINLGIYVDNSNKNRSMKNKIMWLGSNFKFLNSKTKSLALYDDKARDYIRQYEQTSCPSLQY